MAMLRTLASLIIMFFFGLIWLTYLGQADDPSGLLFILGLSLFVSTCSAAACLSFLWIMRRGMNLQKIPTPRNTSVWMMFYALSMAGLLAYWFVLIMEEMMTEPVRNAFLSGCEFVFECIWNRGDDLVRGKAAGIAKRSGGLRF